MTANLITKLARAFRNDETSPRDRRPARRVAFRPTLDGLEARISLSGATTVNTGIQVQPAPRMETQP